MPRERTGSSADLLAVGLGNPGDEYSGTRHNAGAWVAGLLASRHQERLKAAKQLRSQVAQARVGGLNMAVAVPLVYMNDSGSAAAALVRRYGIEDLNRLVIIHDELDLPLGTVRVKMGGGIAGHNGLRSIQSHLSSLDFCRVRVGIGRPPGRQSAAEYVLRAPASKERAVLDVAVEVAADALEMILLKGSTAAMNQFNGTAPPGS